MNNLLFGSRDTRLDGWDFLPDDTALLEREYALTLRQRARVGTVSPSPRSSDAKQSREL